MLAPEPQKHNSLVEEVISGRDRFLENFCADEKFAHRFEVDRPVLRWVSPGLCHGYRRAGDEEIIETLVSKHLQLGRPIRCLEIGAGATAQWSEGTGNRGAPWLSRYLALHHADKFDITASDGERSVCGDHISMSVIHWPVGELSWKITAETFCLWKRDTSAALFQKFADVFSSEPGFGVATSGAPFGLRRRDFAPSKGACVPRFSESSFLQNMIVLPTIAPLLEKAMFNLKFEEGFDISSPSDSFGKFDVIFGRHLGIAKNTLLDGVPKLAKLLSPGGEIFLYTDFSPYTVLITYEGGKLKHSFPG